MCHGDVLDARLLLIADHKLSAPRASAEVRSQGSFALHPSSEEEKVAAAALDFVLFCSDVATYTAPHGSVAFFSQESGEDLQDTGEPQKRKCRQSLAT